MLLLLNFGPFLELFSDMWTSLMMLLYVVNSEKRGRAAAEQAPGSTVLPSQLVVVVSIIIQHEVGHFLPVFHFCFRPRDILDVSIG